MRGWCAIGHGLERLLARSTACAGRHGEALVLVAARLVAEGALARQESRGAHYRGGLSRTASPARRTRPDPGSTFEPPNTAPRLEVGGLTPPLADLLIEPIVRAALPGGFGPGGRHHCGRLHPPGNTHEGPYSPRARPAASPGSTACAWPSPRSTRRPDSGARWPTRTVCTAEANNSPKSEADARALLSAERVALNLLGRLSGVATLTAAYVRAVEGTGAKITCTRKTTPGLRALEKYAVRCGGGINHRFGLDDAILIKDNHIAACGGVAAALKRAQAAAGHLVKIEIEVDNLAQLDEALPLAAPTWCCWTTSALPTCGPPWPGPRAARSWRLPAA